METLDKFYTKESVAKQCVGFIDFISKDHIVIEPSAGNGSFINAIKDLNCEYFFYDI